MIFGNERLTFDKRLADTIKWCSRKLDLIDLHSALRSSELLPKNLESIKHGVLIEGGFENDSKLAPLFMHCNPHRLLKEVVKKRAEIISNNTSLTPQTTTWRISEGKLLCWDFDIYNDDGALQSLSNGFFGLNDDPPWDTWVHHFKARELVGKKKVTKEYLLCWIPYAFIETANEAIPAAVFNNLVWLDELVRKPGVEIPKWLKEYANNMIKTFNRA